jgi:pyruvate ferredoxin oxidoreductase beta subunit
MEKLNVFAAKLVPKNENFTQGHRACQGCAEALAIRQIGKALGKNVVTVSATGCMEVVSSPFPYTSWNVPWIHVAFENAAAVASGVEAGLKAMMRKGKVPKRKILERGHDFLYICTDNEAYMNTGIQRSSATPWGASTTTSPAGKVIPGQATWKKNMAAIAAAHDIPYVATACPSYPFDLMEKVKRVGVGPQHPIGEVGGGDGNFSPL